MICDLYAKAVLTVIAGALCLLVVQNAIPASRAQADGIQKVQICDDHSCLRLSPLRRQASMGDRFLSFALPIFVESP